MNGYKIWMTTKCIWLQNVNEYKMYITAVIKQALKYVLCAFCLLLSITWYNI